MDIVVNKRYYDFDYDNNAIIMFDADDAATCIDWDPHYESDVQCPVDDEEKVPTKHAKGDSAALDGSDPSAIVSASQSTETVPDDAVPASPQSSKSPTPPKSRKRHDSSSSSSSLKRKSSGVTWICSESPKGSKRIPYALQVAHSYTINRLQVQLTTLVDTATVKKQQAARAKRHAARKAAQYQQMQYQQYNQYAAHQGYVYPAAAYGGGQAQYGHNYPAPHHGQYPARTAHKTAVAKVPRTHRQTAYAAPNPRVMYRGGVPVPGHMHHPHMHHPAAPKAQEAAGQYVSYHAGSGVAHPSHPPPQK